MWIVAASRDQAVCQGLVFSYGVEPVQLADEPPDWRSFAETWLRNEKIPGTLAMLVSSPSPQNPGANYRIEFLRIPEANATSK